MIGKLTRLQIFVGIVTVAVLAVVITGLYLAGSPNAERLRRFDDGREQDLEQIAGAIDTVYMQENRLPSSLDELTPQTGQKSYYIRSIKDPRTGAFYEYRAIDAVSYELCATFDGEGTVKNAGEVYPRSPYPAYPEGVSDIFPRTHSVGRTCFILNAEQRIGRPSCGLRNPCATGQTCAVLPNHEGAFCVPEGKECLAAGCAGSCVLAESYPVQVRCTVNVP